jgi:error-prone DNA polymerase
MYLELHASSAFSFLDGASLPEALVDRAASLGYRALALMDRDGVYGAPRFHQAAKSAGLKAIIGAEITVGPGAWGVGPEDRAGHRVAGPRPQALSPALQALWRLPVLVESREGYRNLCRLVTRMKLRAPKGEGALTLDELDGQTAGLVALVGRTALRGGQHGVGGLLDRLLGLFGGRGVYVELQRHLLRDEEADNQTLVDLASAFHVPVIATNGVRFAGPPDRPLYDVLTCIRHKTTLDRAGRRLSWNAERYLKSPEQMAQLFRDRPEAIQATGDLADRLQYTMADLGYRFPEYPVPPGETMSSFLRKIALVGARERYRPLHDRAARQIDRELALIEKLDLAGYFLIVWDIVNFCRQHGILVQGRGSAANSAVCYSLGITAVDPVGMDLLFERFLSEERGEWPDIDLDLPSGDRRERVIQHVYEKYGGGPKAALEGPRAGMTANVITYRGRSAAREVGKALDLDAAQIDRLAKVLNNFEWIDPRDTLGRYLREVGLDADNPRIRIFGDLWQRIQDLPRHLGQHSGGMVICHGRLDEIVPLENASMPGRVVVQWDKDDCAEMGIVKVDLLGLGMMAALQDALVLINEGGQRPETGGEKSQSGGSILDLAHLPPDDPAVYRMLQEADTIGVFQVESRAQMATLPRLRPARFYDIVVEVAIIRPGPIVGQMVHPYLKRRQGTEPVVYPHPSLAPILERTLGVPLFQEQLLRMAMVAAGFSGGQAEELRRAFGFKRSEQRMQKIEAKLREGMAGQGITGAPAEEIIRSITAFALYGFPESHAASFALLVYASAYLKAHYPAAFYTALLNNQPMGFYHPATLVKDAQRRGVRFAPIDVQRSSWLCTIEPDGSVRLGLCYVAGLREEVGRAIEARGQGSEARGQGPGASLPAVAHTPRAAEAGGQAGSNGHAAPRCPKCGCDDRSMLEVDGDRWFCNTCAHDWSSPGLHSTSGDRSSGLLPLASGLQSSGPRFASLDDLIARTGVHRDELTTLAEVGAVNALGGDRRSALWQVERAIRPAGELFREDERTRGREDGRTGLRNEESGVAESSAPSGPEPRTPAPRPQARVPPSPLLPMTLEERIIADYDGTGLTIGPHPMSLRRSELALRGVLRASDLPRGRSGRRVRVAGAVITRQRPGTAKGFVFLTLEDETGIANVIVRPDLFVERRSVIVGEPYLLVEGTLQIQEGVTSVKADRLEGLARGGPDIEAHDFY